MKNYLLDTNIIGHLAEYKSGIQTERSISLEKYLSLLPESTRLFICSISIGELEYGLQVAYPRDSGKLQHIRDLIDPFPIKLQLDINSDVAKNYYAKLKAKLFEEYAPKDKKSRQNRIDQWRDPVTAKELKIQENDIWISSVAMAFNLILVTNDKMNSIKEAVGTDLEIVDWFSG
jgi:predicted nucleic acid-binding protein